MSPLISIIIPAYNVAAYIDESLKSIIEQTIDDYEIIIIDDASTDNTVPIIKDFLEHHTFRFKPIFLINPQNYGCATTRNIGIHFARGKYICFFDADDFYKPTFLQILSEKIIREKCDFVFCGYDVQNYAQKSYKEYTSFKQYPKFFHKWYILRNSFIGKTHIAHWAALYDLNFLRKNNLFYFDGCRKAADTEFVFYAMMNCKKIRFVTQSLYIYNIRPNSITTSGASNKLFDGYYAYKRMLLSIRNPFCKFFFYVTKFPRETYLILEKFYKEQKELPYLYELPWKIFLYCILNILINHQHLSWQICKWFYLLYIKKE